MNVSTGMAADSLQKAHGRRFLSPAAALLPLSGTAAESPKSSPAEDKTRQERGGLLKRK